MKAQTADRFLSTAIRFTFAWEWKMHFLFLRVAMQCIIYCVYILDLTACSTVLLKNSSSAGQEISPPPLPFYKTRRFITLLTRVHQLSLSWSRQIQSMSSKIRFNTHPSSTTVSSKYFSPSGFATNSVCMSLLPIMKHALSILTSWICPPS